MVCVCLLGAIKLKPRQRYFGLCAGFLSSGVLYIAAYLTGNYTALCVLMFLGGFANTLGNSIFNASLMLALPEENRGGILGLVGAASAGGSALSAVIYGMLCDVFPMYLVFIAGVALSAVPMVYMCIHRNMREFILTH